MAEIDVPVISLKGFFTDDPAQRSAVVARVKDACLRCGFFMIADHGVDMGVVDRAWLACRSFFDAPLAVKEAVPMRDDYPYGYVGLQGEIAGGTYEYGAADQKESFSICLGPAASPDPRMPAPRWPEGREDFVDAVSAYYREMESLARLLLRIFALALDLNESYFAPFDDSHWSAMRMLNYPHSDKPFAPGQMRIAPHTDYGSLTILRADNSPGGLQVQRKDGGWQDVVFPAADTFTINLGDLMQRWTNDLWKSTLHRVVPPPVAGQDGGEVVAADNRRASIAFFHNLNRDAVCSTFPSCVSADRPSRYEPIRAFDHLMARHAQATGQKTHLTSGDGEGEGEGPKRVGGADITGAAWRQAASEGDGNKV
jgi:isopenicillin N synthase-like dioxygenase